MREREGSRAYLKGPISISETRDKASSPLWKGTSNDSITRTLTALSTAAKIGRKSGTRADDIE